MLQPFEQLWNAGILAAPQVGLARLYAIGDGILRTIRVIAPNKTSVGDATFNVSINGTYLFSVGSALIMNAPATIAEKTGLSIAFNDGDVLSFDLVVRGSANIPGPIYFAFLYDDGLGIAIGDDIVGADDGAVLFVNGTALDQDTDRFAYKPTAGNQGQLRLGDTSLVFDASGIDKNKSILQVADLVPYAGNLGHSYFGIWASIVRGGNNGVYQTSAIRGRAVYSGSSPDGPTVTGGEFFSSNSGSTNNSVSVQGSEGIANADDDAENIQGAAGFANVLNDSVINDFAAGIFGIATAAALSTTPKFAGLYYKLFPGGSILKAIGCAIEFHLLTAGTVTDLIGLNIELFSSTTGVTNSYGILIDDSIDVGSSIKRAIKSLSTALSEFAGPISVPADPYDETGWDNNNQVPTKGDVRDALVTLLAANDAMVYKGVIDASGNPNYPAADAGHTYRISVAGKIGGASGINVEVGDLIICITDGTAAGNQATVGSHWSIQQTNIDGAVTGPSSSTSGNIATFSGVSGKVIQDGGKALPSGAIVGTSDSQTLTNKTIAGGSNSISGIDETMLSTSDITTLNVTTSKHGFAPKLPNDATKYLDGSGAYSVPAGSGGGVGVDAKPTTGQNTEDTEFDDTSGLDSKWTEIVNTNCTIYRSSIIPGAVVAKMTGGTGEYTIEQAYAPGAGVAFDLMVSFIGGPFFNFHTMRLEARNTSNTDAVSVYQQYSSGQKVIHTTRTGSTDTNNVSPTSLSPTSGQLYLRLHRDASNVWTSYYSYDGFGWTKTGLSNTNSFTVQKIRILLQAGGGNVPILMGIQWFRRDFPSGSVQ